MNAMTSTQVRQNFSKTIKSVINDHEPVIITSKREAVVMMSLEDYEALEETAYLMRSPENHKRILRSIEQLEQGLGKERKLVAGKKKRELDT